MKVFACISDCAGWTDEGVEAVYDSVDKAKQHFEGKESLDNTFSIREFTLNGPRLRCWVLEGKKWVCV